MMKQGDDFMRVNKTKQLVLASLLAAIVCIATMVTKFPSPPPLKGYINLGDCVVLLSGWLSGPVWGFLAAGIGSALADLILGYTIYIPATFLIKGLMAVVAFYIARRGTWSFRILSALLAELVMVAGYYLFDAFLYGFATSAINVPGSLMQGFAGFVTGLILMRFLEKGNWKR